MWLSRSLFLGMLYLYIKVLVNFWWLATRLMYFYTFLYNYVLSILTVGSFRDDCNGQSALPILWNMLFFLWHFFFTVGLFWSLFVRMNITFVYYRYMNLFYILQVICPSITIRILFDFSLGMDTVFCNAISSATLKSSCYRVIDMIFSWKTIVVPIKSIHWHGKRRGLFINY